MLEFTVHSAWCKVDHDNGTLELEEYLKFCFAGFALLIAAMVFAIGALRSARHLHNGLLRNTLRLPMSFFDTTPLGRIMNRFSKDTVSFDNAFNIDNNSRCEPKCLSYF